MEFTLTGGERLFAETRGEGAPVLFLHGWATTGRIWRPVFERWRGGGTLVALDLRGAGYSAKPAGVEAYSVDHFADDVLQVARQLGARVALVGHSMGGMIAQRVASLAPERVAQLVLVSPTPAGGVPLPDADVAYFKSLAGTRSGMETVFGSMMAKRPDAATFERLVDDAASVLPTQYVAALDAWRGADFAAELGRITAPTTVLCGCEEQPLNPELLQAVVTGLVRGARQQVLDGVGHYPHYEAPDAFTAALEAALG